MVRYELVKVEIVESNMYEVGRQFLAITDRKDDFQPYGLIINDREVCWMEELLDDSNKIDDLRVELCDSDWIHWVLVQETKCKEV